MWPKVHRARSIDINQPSLRANNCIFQVMASLLATFKSWSALSHCQKGDPWDQD